MCFNDNSTFDIYRVSSRICTQANYMRQVGPVNRDELRELATAYKDGIPKPTKVNGTRWIDHKYKVRTWLQFSWKNVQLFMNCAFSYQYYY